MSGSEIIGHGIMYGVFFYSMFNYIHYRNIREEREKEDDKE